MGTHIPYTRHALKTDRLLFLWANVSYFQHIMETGKRVIRGHHRIYIQTPENGAIFLGLQEASDNNNQPEICLLQGQEVYVLTNEEELATVCDENDGFSTEHSLEIHVNDDLKNGCKGANQDEDLTPLSWLQNTNLLQNINLANAETPKKSTAENKTLKVLETPHESDEAESSCDGSNHSSSEGSFFSQANVLQNGEETKSKPPHSFSTLIFLAIESSATKALPVRDIYSWITHNFPYYRHAPVGWKNSVRHNLSLNKCFYKVEGGLNLSKGSFWMVDPAHRPQLIQSLCKVSYIKTEVIQQLMQDSGLPSAPLTPLPTPTKVKESVSHDISAKPMSATKSSLSTSLRPNPNLPDPKLFPFLSRRLAFSNVEGPDVEVDAATAMLALGQSCIKHLVDEPVCKDDSWRASPPSHTSPVDDHTYSYAPRLLIQNKIPQKRTQTGCIAKQEIPTEDYMISDHVPHVVRELEVRSIETSAPTPTKQAKGERRPQSNGARGRGRGRARGRGRRR